MRAQMRSFVRWRCGPRMVNELVIPMADLR